jgi:RNA polymerase sigma-70 factor (ECF subfamily)
LVEHFFRHETGRLHGALIRVLGVHNLALAEDLAQEAMLRALRAWSMGGVPANPPAWIMRVAMNLATDALRHRNMSAAKEADIITHVEQMTPQAAVIGETAPEIRDDALRLMFVCCHPSIAPDAQVVLALKVLCGFSTGEIARAFLTSEAAIEKQLTRTKQRIAAAGIGFEFRKAKTYAAAERRAGRIVSSVQRRLQSFRRRSPAARRALRRSHPPRLAPRRAPRADTPRAHALLALMLLTSARFRLASTRRATSSAWMRRTARNGINRSSRAG